LPEEGVFKQTHVYGFGEIVFGLPCTGVASVLFSEAFLLFCCSVCAGDIDFPFGIIFNILDKISEFLVVLRIYLLYFQQSRLIVTGYIHVKEGLFDS
jgi:hypothetical protein